MANKISHISERQTRYALRMYKALEVKDEYGSQVDNLMYITVERPFVLLHAVSIDQSNPVDRNSEMNQGVTNALLYLENHPIVQVAQVAEISAFHISANRYYIDDIRENKETDDQYVFVLLCLNY